MAKIFSSQLHCKSTKELIKGWFYDFHKYLVKKTKGSPNEGLSWSAFYEDSAMDPQRQLLTPTPGFSSHRPQQLSWAHSHCSVF